jgi:hypothetical protein
MRSWSFPAGVVASIPSDRETNATLSACNSSSSRIRCRRLRPSLVQSQDDERVKPTALGGADERLKRRPGILRSRHSPVHKLRGLPTASRSIASQLLELLILLLLIERADADGDRRSREGYRHDGPPPPAWAERVCNRQRDDIACRAIVCGDIERVLDAS